MTTISTVASRMLLGALMLITTAGCVPPRTLVIRVPPGDRPTTGVTHSCTQVDQSSTDVGEPPLQATCDGEVISDSDPIMGNLENMPNMRHVYANPCLTLYEVRVFDPSSDHPRIAVTCASQVTGGE